jgi:putative transposase
MIPEMLEDNNIQPRQSYFSSPIMMITKMDGSWNMCPIYRLLNKMTIKDNLPIPVIHELLDELHIVILFSKLYLHLRYHKIIMRQEDIPKTSFKTHLGYYEF